MTTLNSTYRTSINNTFSQISEAVSEPGAAISKATDYLKDIPLHPSTVTVKDPGSALTHFIGFVAAATAGPFLLERAVNRGGDFLTVFSCVIFILGMLLLYGASTSYHTVTFTGELGLKFKRFDHMMIFMLIAGSYTPVCLTVLRRNGGYLLLAAVWGISIAGMIFKYFWVTCPKWVSSVIYIGLGWACVFSIPTLFRLLPLGGFLWLLIGGLIYTAGGVIYAMKFKVFNNLHRNFGSHEIFHLFVMAGNLCHFIFVYFYLV